MYRCGVCNAVANCIPSRRVVLSVRPSSYPLRANASKVRIRRKLKQFDDRGGSGTEVAKEVLVCVDCSKTYADKTPETIAARPMKDHNKIEWWAENLSIKNAPAPAPGAPAAPGAPVAPGAPAPAPAAAPPAPRPAAV